MSRAEKGKMTRNTIPDGFSASLALVDLIPVLFFGLSAIQVGRLFSSVLFVISAVVCLLSGVVKVLWKLIVALCHRNIWFMFVQMRILMPLGLFAMLAALIIGRANLNGTAILAALTGFPACIFFLCGVVGMGMMTVFAFRLDSSNPKANWLEQIVNGIAQICFFIGLLLV